MSNKKQTAVDFFLSKLPIEIQVKLNTTNGVFYQAKELEKQQMMEARQDGFNRCFRKGDRKEITNEQYYKETYE